MRFVKYVQAVIMAFCMVTPLCAAAAASSGAGKDETYSRNETDIKDETDRKVEELLSRMTLREKIGQMNQLSGGYRWLDAIRAGECGSVLNCSSAEEIRSVQKAAVEESRLGIPLLVSRDVIHGYRTIFPVPLGQAATFDPEIVEKGAGISAREATAAGIRWTFSPMLDISRDPRWGRVAEGSGEDPYLNTVMGLAMLRGYQGDSLGAPASMAACIKHFVGYGAAEGGRDYNTAGLTERALRNVYFPAFKAAAEAGAATLMTGFHDLDGIPCTGNAWLLEDILRGEWNWNGIVVSDYRSVEQLAVHGYAQDLKQTAQQAIAAGVDMDMMSFAYIAHAEELVAEGRLSEEDIDKAVRNILRLKFELGLFDNPYADPDASAKTDYAPEHLEAAKQSALESVILLKNGNGTLPLADARTILVTGPLADAPYDQLGTWAFDGQKEHTVTPLAALRNEYDVIYEPGLEYSRDRNTAGFSKVRKAAAKADAAVVFVGEEAILSGEAHSLSDLNLKGAQSELVAQVAKAGKPVVLVVIAGRPLTIEKDMEKCDAVLYCFHPGTMGGPALSDLIKGKASPSGKLPMTFIREAGQAPMYYNRCMTGRPYKGDEPALDEIPLEAVQSSTGCTSFYLDSGSAPLFPFGYGLSYTSFEYSEPCTDRSSYETGDVIKACVTVTNTGSCKADETVQLYIRDPVASAVRPVRELKRFQRVGLEPGESRTVCFELPVSELAFWNARMEYVVEPGLFHMWLAGDSVSGERLEFEVR